MKLLIPLMALFGVGALAWSIDVASTQRRIPSAGDIAESAPAALPSVIHAAGRIEGATQEIELLPELAGRIAEVYAAEGAIVEQGALLMRLEDATLAWRRDLAAAQMGQAEAELQRLINGAHPQERAEARAQVEAAVAARELAQKTWQRIAQLSSTRAATEQDADERMAEVHAAEAALAAATARLELIDSPTRQDDVRIAQTKLEVARAELGLAEAELAKTRITAPIAGTILKVDVEPGELISPTSPLPAIVMADTGRLRVRAFVEELHAPRVRVGMPATLSADGLPDVAFEGTVAVVSPTMTRKTLTSDRPDELYDTKVREVWIDLEGDVDLVIGLRVDVKIDSH